MATTARITFVHRRFNPERVFALITSNIDIQYVSRELGDRVA